MSNIPNELKYALTHEWALLDDEQVVTVGISDHAQEALGDVVFVELPELGATLDAGEEAGVVESVKAASDIYSPVSGEVVEINESLLDEPELVNGDPYTDGWFFKMKAADVTELDAMLDAESYENSFTDEDIEDNEEDED